jgi:hypothetical protein
MFERRKKIRITNADRSRTPIDRRSTVDTRAGHQSHFLVVEFSNIRTFPCNEKRCDEAPATFPCNETAAALPLQHCLAPATSPLQHHPMYLVTSGKIGRVPIGPGGPVDIPMWEREIIIKSKVLSRG